MDLALRSWIVLVFITFPIASAFAQPEAEVEVEAESLYDYIGPYLQAGVAVGFFDAHKGSVDFDPGIGFAVSAGYRVNAYLAGQMDLTYIFEADTDDFLKVEGIDFGESDKTKTLEHYEVTINLKGYPLGYYEVSEVPDWVQPYAKFGFGFAEAKLGPVDEVRFLLRFGAGLDFMINDQFGVYLDGGYSVITQTVREGNKTLLDGHGQLGLGGVIRF
jgi:hypothetical protein